ncbi:hypothetical protein PT276_03380 [Orbaceae bacterium ESL0721]|nr:hypothetical protein [Orbaceae bacterium ESL0721]
MLGELTSVFGLLNGYLLKNRISKTALGLISFPLFLSFPALAATSTLTTKGIVTGTAPYLTFDNGQTKATDTAALLTIKLSDGRVYGQTNNTSTPTNPIMLPVEGQTLADVQMFMPLDRKTVSLSELIAAPNNYWGDDNGDGKGVNGIAASGSLTLKIQDSTGRVLDRNDTISLCDGATYYKVDLSGTAGSLQTKYGIPNKTDFAASNITYYIKPKPTSKPYVCNAQPNLNNSGGTHNGPITEWDPAKGFKVQRVNTPSSNFPTMGAHGLFFNLTIAGDVWQNMSYDKSPASSGIDISIGNGGSANVAKVMLNGPRYNTNNATTAVPTTFTIYSDKAKTNKVYSFTIGKWFIATPMTDNTYNEDYCLEHYGSKYRVPNITEYTNANGNFWEGGLAGQPNNYQRRIGGGLFAEWGDMRNNLVYTSSDFDFDAEGYGTYWASEKYNDKWQYFVYSDDGAVLHAVHYTTRYACVTP